MKNESCVGCCGGECLLKYLKCEEEKVCLRLCLGLGPSRPLGACLSVTAFMQIQAMLAAPALFLSLNIFTTVCWFAVVNSILREFYPMHLIHSHFLSLYPSLPQSPSLSLSPCPPFVRLGKWINSLVMAAGRRVRPSCEQTLYL